MNNSKIQEAKAVPACGRAVTGILLIETSTAGRSSMAESSTRSPVSGLTPAGNWFWSGPMTTGVSRGWAVEGTNGVPVAARVGTVVAAGAAGVGLAGEACGVQPAPSRPVKRTSRNNRFMRPL